MKKILTAVLFMMLATTAFGRGNWVCEAIGDDGRYSDYFTSECSDTLREAERDAMRDCRRDFNRRDCSVDTRDDCWRDRECRRGGNDDHITPDPVITEPSLGTLQTHCNCNTGKRCYMKNGKATQCIYECQNGYRFSGNSTVFANAQCTIVK